MYLSCFGLAPATLQCLEFNIRQSEFIGEIVDVLDGDEVKQRENSNIMHTTTDR